ncbi:MAG: DUF4245 domain-containing protein [Propionibacteriaceae bacterium]
MARDKKPKTVGDMIRSLAVILVPVLIITFFFTRNLDDSPVTVVDWRPVLAQAREQSPFPVLAPTNLPSDWRPTRVAWVKTGNPYLNGDPAVRNTWQLGFLTPKDIYVELNQGDAQPEDFIKDETREGRPDGQSTVNGKTWDRLVTTDDRTRSLVQTSTEVTTIVVGDTSYEELESYTATLSAS